MSTIAELNKSIAEAKVQFFMVGEDQKIIPDGVNVLDIDLMTSSGLLNSVKGKRVLDIGCDRGLFSFIVKKAGAAYVLGIDPHAKAIDLAKEVDTFLQTSVEFRCENFTAGHGKFDIILCMSVYHYLYGKYGNHESIFRTFYYMCDELYWENPWDMTDWTCKKRFDELMPTLTYSYTKDAILKAASIYFDITYVGSSSIGTRHILYLKKKKFKADEIISMEVLYTNGDKGIWERSILSEKIFYDDKIETLIKRVERNNVSYVLKTKSVPTESSQLMLKNSYDLYYPLIKDIPGVVQVYETKLTDDNQFSILMEYLKDYESLVNIYYHHKLKKFDLDTKKILLIKILTILSEIFSRGVGIIDIGPENVMMNTETGDIKIIDLDCLFLISDKDKLEKVDTVSSNFNYSVRAITSYAYYFMVRFLKWFLINEEM